MPSWTWGCISKRRNGGICTREIALRDLQLYTRDWIRFFLCSLLCFALNFLDLYYVLSSILLPWVCARKQELLCLGLPSLARNTLICLSCSLARASLSKSLYWGPTSSWPYCIKDLKGRLFTKNISYWQTQLSPQGGSARWWCKWDLHLCERPPQICVSQKMIKQAL